MVTLNLTTLAPVGMDSSGGHSNTKYLRKTPPSDKRAFGHGMKFGAERGFFHNIGRRLHGHVSVERTSPFEEEGMKIKTTPLKSFKDNNENILASIQTNSEPVQVKGSLSSSPDVKNVRGRSRSMSSLPRVGVKKEFVFEQKRLPNRVLSASSDHSDCNEQELVIVQTKTLPILQSHNHILTRTLLDVSHSFIADATTNSFPLKIDGRSLTNLVLQLHGDPCALFLDSLALELAELKNLAIVMRERSVSVQVLQYISQSLNLPSLVLPFVTWIRGFTHQKLKILTENHLSESTKEKKRRDKIKEQLIRCVKGLLLVENIPKIISALCFRCLKLASSLDKPNDDSVLHWAVGSLIFLRFLVPAITELAADPTANDAVKKTAVLVGRFLMKLCCNSRFEDDSLGLLNEVLVECGGMFDQFCEEVAGEGEKNSDFIGSIAVEKNSVDLCGVTLDNLSEFLRAISFEVMNELSKRMEKEVPPLRPSSDEVWCSFEKEVLLLLNKEE